MQEDFDEESDLLLSQMYIPETENVSSASDVDDREDFKLNREQTENRFRSPVTEEEIQNLQKNRIPPNTRKNTNWCINLYDSWGCARNTFVRDNGVTKSEQYSFVPPLSADIPADILDFWMCRFVCEINRQDGTPYPASTLKNICIGIWRHLRDRYKRYDLNFFDEKKETFSNFRATLDGQMKLLNSRGIGINKKQAQPLDCDDETKLWDSKVFNVENAKGLFNAIYYYNSKIFGLRAADEHKNLTIEQFQFGEDNIGEYVIFQGKNCKNYQGGLKDCGRVQFRTVKQYTQEENDRCYVKLLKLYLDNIGENNGPFYRRPLAPSRRGQIVFSKQVVGLHTIQKLMKTICNDAGLVGRFTGHSSKVTTATTLFNNKVEEQLVMERTGHRSSAVRSYKRTSCQLQKEISDLLQPPINKRNKIETVPKCETITKCDITEECKPVKKDDSLVKGKSAKQIDSVVKGDSARKIDSVVKYDSSNSESENNDIIRVKNKKFQAESESDDNLSITIKFSKGRNLKIKM